MISNHNNVTINENEIIELMGVYRPQNSHNISSTDSYLEKVAGLVHCGSPDVPRILFYPVIFHCYGKVVNYSD